MKILDRKTYSNFKRELAVEAMYLEEFKENPEKEKIKKHYRKLRRRKMTLEEFESNRETKYLLNRFNDLLNQYKTLL